MTRKRVDVYYYPGSAESKGEAKKCGLCNGTGRDHTNSLVGVVCPACGGKGWIRV